MVGIFFESGSRRWAARGATTFSRRGTTIFEYNQGPRVVVAYDLDFTR